jgi:tetratricopeptide (TPR) repeat protein
VSPPARTLAQLLPALSLSLAAGCATVPPGKPAAAAAADPAALTIVAEIALERGKCRVASETYATAAQIGSAAVAHRASDVGLACEDLPAAWRSVQRWYALQPRSREAEATYATVALKLYRIADARAAVRAFLRPPRSAGSPARTRALADGRLAALTGLLLGEADASAVLAVLDRAVDRSSASPAALTLLGEVALEAYDGPRAERYARLALRRSPREFQAQRLLARAEVMLGNPERALSSARRIAREHPRRGAFEPADIDEALGRTEDAHRELERLRGDAPPSEIERRLAVLSFQSGDLADAQERFVALAEKGDASDATLMYLSDIAAREGDVAAALAGYGKLEDSPLGMAARSKAAALLFASHRRASALALLDAYAAKHPERRIDVTITEAQLLSEHGAAAAALKLLEASLRSHPQHPELEYQRAVTLEQAGELGQSVQAFDRLLAERPGDPTLMNALGYTLADHHLQLARADSLIRRALAAMPDNPAVLDSFGWVRLREGDAAAAVPALARAYSLSHDAQIAAHWGEALWRARRHGAARRVWAEALARAPHSKSLMSVVKRYLPDAN